jgi:hypothetical protein
MCKTSTPVGPDVSIGSVGEMADARHDQRVAAATLTLLASASFDFASRPIRGNVEEQVQTATRA